MKRVRPTPEASKEAEILHGLGQRRASDEAQDAAVRLLELASKGQALSHANPNALLRRIVEGKRIDLARREAKHSRRIALGVNVDEVQAQEAAEPTSLQELQEVVREEARREAYARGWPGRWWFLVGGARERCPRCKRGVALDLPVSNWIRVVVDGCELRVPLACPACNGEGRAPRMKELPESLDRGRPNRRKQALKKATRARARGDEKAWVQATFAASDARGETARERLVYEMCSTVYGPEPSTEAEIGDDGRPIERHVYELRYENDAAGRIVGGKMAYAGTRPSEARPAQPEEGRAPSARDLGLAALIAGDFPAVADGRTATPASVIKTMTATMRAIHKRAPFPLRPLRPAPTKTT